MTEIKVGPGRTQESRCAYCRGAFEPTDAAVPCPSCGTVLHDPCRAELGRCPTLGCAAVSASSPGAPLDASARRQWEARPEPLDSVGRVVGELLREQGRLTNVLTAVLLLVLGPLSLEVAMVSTLRGHLIVGALVAIGLVAAIPTVVHLERVRSRLRTVRRLFASTPTPVVAERCPGTRVRTVEPEGPGLYRVPIELWRTLPEEGSGALRVWRGPEPWPVALETLDGAVHLIEGPTA